MYLIRKLTASERPAVEALLQALPLEQRRLRFGFNIPAEGITSYVSKLDFDKVIIFGAFSDTTVLAGICELHGEGHAAEAAFAVLPAHQGHGLGHKLMERAVLEARLDGVDDMWIMCVPENAPMRALAASAGMVEDAPERASDDVEAHVRLKPVHPAELAMNSVKEFRELGLYSEAVLLRYVLDQSGKVMNLPSQALLRASEIFRVKA